MLWRQCGLGSIRYDVVSSDDDVRCVDMVMGER